MAPAIRCPKVLAAAVRTFVPAAALHHLHLGDGNADMAAGPAGTARQFAGGIHARTAAEIDTPCH
jgi:hypothetical protein